VVVDVGRQGLSWLMHHARWDQQGGLEDGVKIDGIGVTRDGVRGCSVDWVWRGWWWCN